MRRAIRFFLSGLLGLLLVGCAHNPRNTDHLFGDFTPMGHRGAAGLAPENTMASFEAAAAMGVGFELDTQHCGSGELIVIHDDELERTAGAPGRASETPLADLRGLDAGSWFGPSFAGEPIPTLDEVFTQIGGRVLINVEVKSVQGSDNAQMAADLVALIDQHGIRDQVIVTSFSPFLLEQVRLVDPELVRGQIYGTFKGSSLKWYEKVLLRNLAFNRKAVPDLLMVEDDMVDARYLKKMHRRGYRVFTWTVNEAEEMERLKALGVDGIITDYPDRLLAL